VITDVAIMRRGQIQLACAVDDIADRYVEVLARPEHVDAAEEMGPIHRRDALGRTVMLYDGVAHQRLAPLGELRTPPLAEVFAALASGGDAGEPRGGSR
jgi:ABC-2 type transport system ATP-binding protein